MVIHGLDSWYALILRNVSSFALCLDPRRISRRNSGYCGDQLRVLGTAEQPMLVAPIFGHDFLASEHTNIR